MKAKRLVSCVCALALSSASLATGFVSAADADAQVTLKGAQITKNVGDSFELNIDLAELNGDAAKGFSGCEFAITYNPAKLQITQVVEGAAFSGTGATGAELTKAPTIGTEVSMVNKSDYNCFDYNIVASEGKDTTIAVLWCTGLESSDYWVKKPGTLLTVKGKVLAGEAGEKIPVNIAPISRDENDKMVFGYIDGDTDKSYTSAVAQQGYVQIGDVLWGDLTCNGNVTAADLVAMVQYILKPEIANISEQGVINGNLYQADGVTDPKAKEVLDANDLFCLKKLILEDYGQSDFPITKEF